MLNKIGKVAQERYYRELINDSKNSIKKLWSTFGPIINPKRTASVNITKIFFKDKVLSDNIEIANVFKDYFCSIGTKLEKNINVTPNHNYMTCTPHLSGSSIILPHYTPQVCCVRDEGILECFDKTNIY